MDDLSSRIARATARHEQSEEDTRLTTLREYEAKVQEARVAFERFRALALQYSVPYDYPEPDSDEHTEPWGWAVATREIETGVQMGDTVYATETYVLTANGKLYVDPHNKPLHEAGDEDWRFDIASAEAHITEFVLKHNLPWNN
jgi:hypothetical protein